ncbi:MAG: hypothetical protein Q8L79_09525 [Methylobacter sp.]|uniref:Nmad2 family putative nucleotide modification protein n=1 Tax=Methylobacter sp. TaxID=2051955 RepID=UPI00272F4105|nr:hypothetical protein [Methylobacter sp.]MDP1665354.1 hypothetical protein [Methylobacter sp.]
MKTLKKGICMIELKKFVGTERLFTYKVAHDGGSAPNPFHGLCTLAICKPAIRRVAKKGDVIVGLGCGKEDESRIIYCMVVDEVVSWAGYIEGCKLGKLAGTNLNNHQNLKGKIPENENDQGDCIWTDPIDFSDSLVSWSGHEGEYDFNRDIKNGENVLIGETYWYFGKGDKHKIRLLGDLKNIIPGRGHRSNSNNRFSEQFVDFFNKQLIERNITALGKMGTPALEPKKTDRQTCSRYRTEERESDAYGEDS